MLRKADGNDGVTNRKDRARWSAERRGNSEGGRAGSPQLCTNETENAAATLLSDNRDRVGGRRRLPTKAPTADIRSELQYTVVRT